MPAQDRARCDQAMSAQHLRQLPDQRGEDCAICPVQGLGVGFAQHGDFVRHTSSSTFMDADDRPSNNSSLRKINIVGAVTQRLIMP